MSYPTEPDWRRAPATSVPIKEDGPDLVRLRAEDAARYAAECEEYADRLERSAASASATAARARADAERWDKAAAAFAEAWPVEEDGS